MATSTFDRTMEITDENAIRTLLKIIAEDPPTEPLSTHPYNQAERDRSEALLDLYLSR